MLRFSNELNRKIKYFGVWVRYVPISAFWDICGAHGYHVTWPFLSDLMSSGNFCSGTVFSYMVYMLWCVMVISIRVNIACLGSLI